MTEAATADARLEVSPGLEARVRGLLARDSVDPDELDELWAALPPASIDDLIGRWEGTPVPTGHGLGRVLDGVHWHGKQMRSANDVSPIVCRQEDGSLVDNVELARGGASLWMVAFRDEVTATMVYDGMATFDHFKRAGDGLLLGVMNGKDVLHRGRHFWFVLESEGPA